MSGISHAITMALEALINRATAKLIEADLEGRYTLRMQKAYNILGWICGVIAFSPLVALFFEVPTDNAGLLTLIDSDGQKLKINHHLIGLATFVSLLESKTGLRTGLEINRQ